MSIISYYLTKIHSIKVNDLLDFMGEFTPQC